MRFIVPSGHKPDLTLTLCHRGHTGGSQMYLSASRTGVTIISFAVQGGFQSQVLMYSIMRL